MRFAVVLHGPEVLDTGLGQRAMAILRSEGEAVAVMSGITGVAAVIDAGLEKEVDISRRRKPSVELASMNERADVLILLNCAKSRESALRFGSIVYSRCKSRITKPLLQVDRDAVLIWKGGDGGLAERMARILELELVPSPSDHVDPPQPGWRRVGGVEPGESVWIDGVVVGKALSRDVELSSDEEGRLKARGMDLKETGVGRLGRVDVFKAHIRSGLTRRTSAMPRVVEGARQGVYLIDHSAEDAVFRCRGARLVITVGDDTSRISGALLHRFGVPTLAIVDGDEDRISSDHSKSEGSAVFLVKPGTDDIVGADVRARLFRGADRMDWDAPISEMADILERIAGDRLLKRYDH